MKMSVTDYALYRWRYVIGYTFIGLLLLSIFAIATLYVPGMLREAEMDSALKSGALSVQSLDPRMVIDLPYHIIQRVGFMFFGVSQLTVKLPSIILGAFTAIGILLMVRAWFRKNVGVVATILAITTTQFLFLIQDGTPAIMFSFLAVWLLTIGIYATRNMPFATFWKVLGCVLMAAALYTPLGIYLVIALGVTLIFHPHVRLTISRISKPRLILAGVLGVLSIVPLVYAIIIKPQVGLDLLGIPTVPFDITAHLITVGKDLFGFFLPSDSHLLRPLYSLGVVLLIGIGLVRLVAIRHTARSLVILVLGLLMIPVVILNPDHVTALYPIAVIAVAAGISLIIRNWYSLFPKNPYARLAGLAPLSILVLGIMVSGVMRYMNSYLYNPQVLSHYSADLQLLKDQLPKEASENNKLALVATSEQRPFYDLVAHYDKRFYVTDKYDADVQESIVTGDAYRQGGIERQPSEIVTNRMSGESDRFYIYKPVAE